MNWRAALMRPAAKPVVFALCLVPLAWFIYGAAYERLGANPAEALIRGLGDWALRFLCIGLSVTPLRVRTGTPQLARFRRMLGLFAFFYASLHLAAYAWLDMGFEWAEVARDIAKRPFILVGFAAWALLVPLAATSFAGAIKRLGGRRWQALHRWVFAVALLALLHFFWVKSGKNDVAEVAIYAVVVGVLLAERALRRLKAKKLASA